MSGRFEEFAYTQWDGDVGMGKGGWKGNVLLSCKWNVDEMLAMLLNVNMYLGHESAFLLPIMMLRT